MRRMQYLNRNGYTLVELLLAMAVFSGMMVIVSLGVLYAIRSYRSSVSGRDAQTNTGYGMEEVLRDTRAAYAAKVGIRAAVPPVVNNGYLCLSLAGRNLVYTVDPTVKALQRYSVTDCMLPQTAASAIETVSGSSVQVIGLTALVNTPSGAIKVPSVTITILEASSSGITDPTTGQCSAGNSFTGFCAATKISSTVSLRGSQDNE